MAKPIRTYDGKSYFEGNVGLGVIPSERLSVAGNISVLSGSVSAVNYFGTWSGNTLSSSQVNVEGVDIKSTGIEKGLFLKTTGDGTVTWDSIEEGDEFTFNNEEINGDLIVRGDIIEYASNGIVFTKTSVFTGPLTTGANTILTFDKFNFKTAHNGPDAEGTTYGIVDAQATSLLSDVTTSVTSTINLVITVTADCTATIYGVAHY